MNTPRKILSIGLIVAATSVAIATLFAGCSTAKTNAPVRSVLSQREDGRIRGFAIPAWRKGDFKGPDYVRALNEVGALGSNYVSIHSTFFQDGMRGTKIFDTSAWGGGAPGIEEQRVAIRLAHEAGLKVLLKPHVNLRTGEGWRGDIGTGMTPEEIAAWFRSYDELILAHARLAEEEHVEMFAVGTELMSIDTKEAEWRDLVAKVRAVYHGPLVYCANHSTEQAIQWWDALDYIGIDAYYPISKTKNPTLPDLMEGWKPYLADCAALSARYGKKIIFTEVGYMAADGTSERPFDWAVSDVYDGQEQADCYESLFESVYRQEWFDGLFLWNWDIHESHDGRYRNGYSPEGKPAESVVRKWYCGDAK